MGDSDPRPISIVLDRQTDGTFNLSSSLDGSTITKTGIPADFARLDIDMDEAIDETKTIEVKLNGAVQSGGRYDGLNLKTAIIQTPTNYAITCVMPGLVENTGTLAITENTLTITITFIWPGGFSFAGNVTWAASFSSTTDQDDVDIQVTQNTNGTWQAVVTINGTVRLDAAYSSESRAWSEAREFVEDYFDD